MTTDEFRSAHQRRPFQPFTIRQADGRETRVSHPECLAYCGGRIAVYIHPTGGVEFIDLLPVPTLVFDAPTAKRTRRKEGP